MILLNQPSKDAFAASGLNLSGSSPCPAPDPLALNVDAYPILNILHFPAAGCQSDREPSTCNLSVRFTIFEKGIHAASGISSFVTRRLLPHVSEVFPS